MAKKWIGGTIAATVLLGSAVTALPCEAKYRIEDGEIVLDSPFELEIGSGEYAKAFGDLIRTDAHAIYDPLTKKTTTNFYHHAEARLATPYFGCEKVSLNFKGEEKSLEQCNFGIGRWASNSGKMMSYSECRETVDKIAADMGKRLGIVMRCTSHVKSEEEAKESVRGLDAEFKRRKEKSGWFATGVVLFCGEKKVKDVSVQYTVNGMFSNKGDYSISIYYMKRQHFKWPSYKPGDKIPVFTNNTQPASSSNFAPTKEQLAAHEEAKKLRETINRLFGVDFDTPPKTNEFSSVDSREKAKREWVPLDKPFEGMTERKSDQFVRFCTALYGNLALRRPYDGDVSVAELKAQAQRCLDRLEKEYGAKIPEDDTTFRMERLAKILGEGVPTFGDTRAKLAYDATQHFTGKVGDIAIEICYAAPRYAKKGEKFEITCKGAVVVYIIQSPDIARGKANVTKVNLLK